MSFHAIDVILISIVAKIMDVILPVMPRNQVYALQLPEKSPAKTAKVVRVVSLFACLANRNQLASNEPRYWELCA